MTVPVPEIFFAPEKSLRTLKDTSDGLSTALMFLSSWLCFLTGILLLTGASVTLGGFLGVYLFTLVLFSAGVVFHAMWVHLFSESLGGRGKLVEFLALLPYAYLPLHLCLPIGILLKNAPGFVAVLAVLPVLFWTKYLCFKSVEVHYGITSAKSFLAGMIPTVFFALPILFVTILLGSIFAGLAAVVTQVMSHIAL